MVKKIPMRMCIGCREMKEKREMIRVLRTQEGEFCLDLTGKMNGRGAYLCRKPECLALALKNHGLERSFHSNIPKETVALLMAELEAETTEGKAAGIPKEVKIDT